MALIHSFERSGNFLFRHRGQIPVILFVLAIPVIWHTGNAGLSDEWRLVITLLAVLLSFLGFMVRAWTIATTPKGTSGRNTDKQVADSLNTKGIYSVVRHPLYLGNWLMWAGIVIFTYNFWFFLVMSLAYWLYYERIMFAEERFLERKYGEAYLSWSEKVPAFQPSLLRMEKSSVPFSFKSVLRREYSGLLATVTGFAFVDQVRYYVMHDTFQPWRISTYFFLGALFIALLLRTLKHSTGLLDESGRS